jgi:hypothetical protein
MSSQYFHSKKWHTVPKDSITFRGEAMQRVEYREIGLQHKEKADKMMNDPNYEKKVNELMAMLQGKRIAGRQQLGSIVNGGD